MCTGTRLPPPALTWLTSGLGPVTCALLRARTPRGLYYAIPCRAAHFRPPASHFFFEARFTQNASAGRSPQNDSSLFYPMVNCASPVPIALLNFQVAACKTAA